MSGEPGAVKLGHREVLSYGVADLAQTAAVQFTSMYLLFFYTDILLVSAAMVGTVFAFSRLWDAINDPIMGVIIDHTHTRFGRCRPYLLPGSLVLALALILAFSDLHLEGVALLVFVVIAYNLFNMAYTATNLPLTAQLPLMTTDHQERIRLSSTRAFFQAVAYTALPVLAEPALRALGGHREPGAYTGIALVLGLFCLVSFACAFLFTRERVTVAPEPIGLEKLRRVFLGQSDWLVLLLANVLVSVALISRVSSAIYHFNYVVGDLALFGTFMALSTLSIIPCSILAHRFAGAVGKRQFAMLGCALGSVGNVLLIAMPQSSWALLLGGTLGGCAVGAFISVLFAMEGDIADRAERRTGIRAQAMVCAAVALGYKIALGIGTGLVGWLLGNAGYVPDSAIQSPAVLAAVNIAFAWIPLGTVLASIGLLLLYPTDILHRRQALA